jgi:hypothetical protein
MNITRNLRLTKEKDRIRNTLKTKLKAIERSFITSRRKSKLSKDKVSIWWKLFTHKHLKQS